MNSIIEILSNPMNILIKKQSLSVVNIIDSDISANQILDQASQFITCTDLHVNDDNLLNELVDEVSTDLINNSQFIPIISSLNQLLEMENKQPTSNTFESMSNSPTLNYLVFHNGNLSSSPSTIDNAILPQDFLSDYNQSHQNVVIPKNITVNQDQSKSVVPVVYTSDPHANLPCNTLEMKIELLKSNKIQIKCQPRSKFRPRTQNESKHSSHYLRCEDGAEHDYPAIYVPPEWACQSDTNIIEIALVDIDKHLHPYVIDNKTVRNSFADEKLIFKQHEPNVLYFRLTNEDFLSGFKTFMIELIKSKQDDVITKKLIRLRRLDQSMLRFRRIYRDQYGQFQRDIDGQEYSCIMTESYGDVSVEHIGPRFGPMSGQEMLFILFKGRFVKEDLSFMIVEPISGWSHGIKKFMINGNLIYFSMPNFPNPQVSRANACIEIYFKQQKIHEFTYLYLNLLDQALVNSNSDISLISNNIHRLQFDILTEQSSAPLVFQKTSKSKPRKRLNSK